MAFRIGSFNVKNLSLSTDRDLDRIARIITENQLDIVAMQEVLSEGKILTGINSKTVSGQAKAYDYSLKRRLGRNWDICWRAPQTHAKNSENNGDLRGEGYAFLWNTARVDVPRDEHNQKIYPKIWTNYKTNVDVGLSRLVRDPCVGRFIARGRKAEIRLITTHIVYKKHQSEGDANIAYKTYQSEENANGMGDVEARNKEFQIIAGQIYPRVSEYYKDINYTSPYTIILGDYNLNLKTSGATKAFMPAVVCFDERGKKILYNEGTSTTIYTVQEDLSTLKTGEDGLANNYDHFSFDGRVKKQIVPYSARTIDAINQSPKENGEESRFDIYRQEVSDHLPIVIEINV